jgi:hypothetical protein
MPPAEDSAAHDRPAGRRAGFRHAVGLVATTMLPDRARGPWIRDVARDVAMRALRWLDDRRARRDADLLE